jgi:branched-chain amino acid transport system substrate-binding protein
MKTAKLPAPPNPASQGKRKYLPPPIVFILLGLGLIFFGPQLLRSCNSFSSFKGLPGLPSSGVKRGSAGPVSSIGDRLLLPKVGSPAKQEGIRALLRQDYEGASGQFKQALTQQRNDPESAIYLENAQALQQGKATTIAVSVPIGSNVNIAQEILRGVAQAQAQVNRSRPAQKLVVAIADDNNDANQAKQIAQALVQDGEIKGVIGHNASDVSLAAAPIYQQGGLVMISPTSSTNGLSNLGDYIFRTAISSKQLAEALVDYSLKTLNKSKVVACSDSQSPDGTSFKDAFISQLAAKGGKPVLIDCDFAAPNFNPTQILADAAIQGADAVLMTPHVDRLDRAIGLAQANQIRPEGRLLMLGNHTLYTYKTLELGQSAVVGLTLPVGWHPKAEGAQTFGGSAAQLWGGEVNWRTAMAYDATLALARALELAGDSPSRVAVQQNLRQTSFSTPGARGEVQFLPTGDRAGRPVMVQVQVGGPNFEFVTVGE